MATTEHAAIATLKHLGYTHKEGAQLWKPPIGKAPDFSLLDTMHARIAELEAELAKAREVPEMPEPDAYMATFKPAGIDALHSVAGSSIEALKYSVPTDSVFTPLLKWSTVRAMFERNKG